MDIDLPTGATWANDNCDDVVGSMPQLPEPSERWSARRKAAVVEAIRGGWVPVEEVCRIYSLSVDEVLAWERTIDRRGVAGLHVKLLQVDRGVRNRR